MVNSIIRYTRLERDNILRSSDIWSHPNRPLIDHLRSVAYNAKALSTTIPPVHKLSPRLQNIIWICGMLHDYAKATSFFQKKLKQRLPHSPEANHSHLSALVTFTNIWNQLEISNERKPESNLPLYAYFAVKNHHGNLESALDDLSISDFSIFETQLDTIDSRFVEDLNDALKRVLKNPVVDPQEIKDTLPQIKNHLSSYKRIIRHMKDLGVVTEVSTIFSLLIDADKLDASGTRLIERPTLPDDFVVKRVAGFGTPTKEINKLRKEAFDSTMQFADSVPLETRRMSLTLPTGLGKTYCAMAIAQRLRDRIKDAKGYPPRIIYCLPFTSIIDQNYEDLDNILGNPPSSIILKHHHMGDTTYRTTEDSEEFDYNKSALLIEGWNSEIVVTTFVQLFFTLAGFRNRSLRRYHNLAGSIVILDEVQSIPYKYWFLFNSLASSISEQLDTRFILVTATQPMIFNDIPEVINNPESYFSKTSRVDFNVDLTPTPFEEFKEDLITSIFEEPNLELLGIFNTKHSAESLFKLIREADCSSNISFLSSSVIPLHRMERIMQMREDKGKGRIAISTQVVEAGVDIDFQSVIRDFAPLDSIIQAAGRCNRNMGLERGKFFVRCLLDDIGSRKPRPFAGYIYDPMLLNATKDILREHPRFLDSDLYRIAVEYFQQVAERRENETSSRILESVGKLNMRAFRDVKLIENIDFMMTDVFVEYDDNASEVLEHYQQIVESSLSRFEKRTEFLKIRRDLMKYTISVQSSCLGALPNIGFLSYISRTDVDRRYDIDTGFIPVGDRPVMF